jgi:hypothetical protein
MILQVDAPHLRHSEGETKEKMVAWKDWQLDK